MTDSARTVSTRWAVTTILVLAVSAAGFILWQTDSFQTRDFPGREMVVPEDSRTDTEEEWGTYQNKRYGFALEYPPFIAEEEINHWGEQDLPGPNDVYAITFPYICKSREGESLMTGTFEVKVGYNGSESDLEAWIRQNEVCGLGDSYGLDTSKLTKTVTSLEAGEALLIEGLGICPAGGPSIEDKIYLANGDYVYMISSLSDNMTPEGQSVCIQEQKEAFEKVINSFRFIGTDVKFINIIFPNGGEKLVQAQTYKVKWESEGVERVDITLMNSAVRGFSRRVVVYYPNSGLLNWFVPPDIEVDARSRYFLEITDSEDSSIYARSEKFTIIY
jgi:hypothetical protein